MLPNMCYICTPTYGQKLQTGVVVIATKGPVTDIIPEPEAARQ